MDDDIIAEQTYFCSSLDVAFGHHTAADFTDLRNIENFADFRISEEVFAQRRRQHAGKHRFHIVNDIVDHGIILNIDALLCGFITRLFIGTGVKGNDDRP